jgi:hypothetical protein
VYKRLACGFACDAGRVSGSIAGLWHVASTTLTSAGWRNSCLLGGDVAAEVARLKELPGDELQVHGSGNWPRP